MFELADQGQALLQEMTGSSKRPSPARRLAFDHLIAGGRFQVLSTISGNIPPRNPSTSLALSVGPASQARAPLSLR